jgi:hypothetical protein
MKKCFLLIVLLNSLFVYAGGTVKIKGSHKFVLVPFVEGIVQRSPFGQVDIGHVYNIHYASHPWHSFLAYSKAGVEFNADVKHFLWAPEFSSELDWRFFCLRGNVADYIEPRINKVYVTPEVGLTLSGFITVACGYNKPLAKTGFNEITPFRVSLSWMLPFAISGASKHKNAPKAKSK